MRADVTEFLHIAVYAFLLAPTYPLAKGLNEAARMLEMERKRLNWSSNLFF
jgi:hypothetical protein